MIMKGEERFHYQKKCAKNDNPGPSSYNNESAFNFATKSRGMVQIGKDKRVSFCDGNNKSPKLGPGSHQLDIKKLDLISLSPSLSRKRF